MAPFNPNTVGLAGDASFDWSNAAEVTIATAFGLVPVVGTLLNALVYILWPASGDDIWGEIEQQVEQLIDQEIDQLVYEQVQNSLQGLQYNVNFYLEALQNSAGDPQVISDTWIAVSVDFLQQLPSFQAEEYQVLLLPLFGQFVNLHLSLLRDGVLNGTSWGWTPAFLTQIQTSLTSYIQSYTQYANQTYQQGYQNIVNTTQTNNHECQPFLSTNAFVRQMTLTVLDFVNLWPYFDPSVYSTPVTVYLSREIYSDPVGTCDDSGPINLPSPPSQPIDQLTVWAWDRIDAVQLTYPAGGGPGGVTQTARMGDQNGGSNQPPYGGTFSLATNAIVTAGGLSGDILNAFTFTFQDGTSTGQLGGNYPGGSSFSFSYPGEVLSSIHINGISSYYGSADCAVFGFKYSQAATPNLDGLRRLYVASPLEISLTSLAAGSVAKLVDLGTLKARAEAEGWNSQRASNMADLAAWKSGRSRG